MTHQGKKERKTKVGADNGLPKNQKWIPLSIPDVQQEVEDSSEAIEEVGTTSLVSSVLFPFSVFHFLS